MMLMINLGLVEFNRVVLFGCLLVRVRLPAVVFVSHIDIRRDITIIYGGE